MDMRVKPRPGYVAAIDTVMREAKSNFLGEFANVNAQSLATGDDRASQKAIQALNSSDLSSNPVDDLQRMKQVIAIFREQKNMLGQSVEFSGLDLLQQYADRYEAGTKLHNSMPDLDEAFAKGIKKLGTLSTSKDAAVEKEFLKQMTARSEVLVKNTLAPETPSAPQGFLARIGIPEPSDALVAAVSALDQNADALKTRMAIATFDHAFQNALRQHSGIEKQTSLAAG